MEAAMKAKIVVPSLYLAIGFALFAVVFIFGLIVLLSLLFGSFSVHGAEFTNVRVFIASPNTAIQFASYSAFYFSGGSIS
jgi:hypothetical protein